VRDLEAGEVVRKVKVENAELTVTVESEPDDIHNAIEDALPGAVVADLEIAETFVVHAYGSEDKLGESNADE